MRSPADVVLKVGLARLSVYAHKNLLAEVNSDVLTKCIPAHLRDPGNKWFAFPTRAPVIVVSKSAMDVQAINLYAELAHAKPRGRICSRPGCHAYNRALVASVIHAKDADSAETWAKG